MAKFVEKLNVRLTKKQMSEVSRLADRGKSSKAALVRHAIDVITSQDHVVVPLGTKERLFIEGICDTAGVQPPDAVKMVLLSYHTLMSKELWRLVKPIDQILDENKGRR